MSGVALVMLVGAIGAATVLVSLALRHLRLAPRPSRGELPVDRGFPKLPPPDHPFRD